MLILWFNNSWAFIENNKTTLKYSVFEISKYPLRRASNKIWYARELILSLLNLAPRAPHRRASRLGVVCSSVVPEWVDWVGVGVWWRGRGGWLKKRSNTSRVWKTDQVQLEKTINYRVLLLFGSKPVTNSFSKSTTPCLCSFVKKSVIWFLSFHQKCHLFEKSRIHCWPSKVNFISTTLFNWRKCCWFLTSRSSIISRFVSSTQWL